MHCTAEYACKAQMDHLNHICRWVAMMAAGGRVRPQALIWHIKYDETPLQMRIRFHSEDVADSQVAKIHVVESRYTIVYTQCLGEGCEEEATYLISGAMSPQVRGSDKRGTAEAIATILNCCVQPPDDALTSCFPFRARVVESDSLAANAKAERILRSEETQQQWRRWHVLEVQCYCHRAHTAAKRTFELMQSTLTGVTNVSLILQGPGMMAETRRVLQQMVRDIAIVKDWPRLSTAAHLHRDNAMSLFTPGHRSAKAVMKYVAAILNGDWREGQLVHYCPLGSGCCRDRHATVLKATHPRHGKKMPHPLLMIRLNFQDQLSPCGC